MVKGAYLFRFGRRLPTYFANLDMKLMPLTPEETEQVIKTGWLENASFRLPPSTNKIEIREFLERVYGMRVKRVETMNVQGKIKRNKGRLYKRPDWKKAIVTFHPFEKGNNDTSSPPQTPPPETEAG